MHCSAIVKDVKWPLRVKCSTTPKAARLRVFASKKAESQSYKRKKVASKRDIKDAGRSSDCPSTASGYTEHSPASVNPSTEESNNGESEQLSRNGKRMGWTLLPKDDDEIPSVSRQNDQVMVP